MEIDLIEGTVTNPTPIDGRALGAKIYSTLPEDDQAVVAFGMSPLWLMEMVERLIREKLGERYAGYYKAPELAEGFSKAFKKSYINEIMTQVHLGLMDAAEVAGRMVS